MVSFPYHNKHEVSMVNLLTILLFVNLITDFEQPPSYYSRDILVLILHCTVKGLDRNRIFSEDLSPHTMPRSCITGRQVASKSAVYKASLLILAKGRDITFTSRIGKIRPLFQKLLSDTHTQIRYHKPIFL
jgi:hypothetical protein